MFTSRQLAFCNGFSCYNHFFSLKYYIQLVEYIKTCWIYNVDIVFVKSHVFTDKKNQEFCNESFRVKTDDSVCCICSLYFTYFKDFGLSHTLLIYLYIQCSQSTLLLNKFCTECFNNTKLNWIITWKWNSCMHCTNKLINLILILYIC